MIFNSNLGGKILNVKSEMKRSNRDWNKRRR